MAIAYTFPQGRRRNIDHDLLLLGSPARAVTLGEDCVYSPLIPPLCTNVKVCGPVMGYRRLNMKLHRLVAHLYFFGEGFACSTALASAPPARTPVLALLWCSNRRPL